MDKFNFSAALEEIWKLVRRTNKYVDETMPWILAKDENKDRLDTVLYNLSESLRIISVLLKPFMGKTSIEIRQQLGIKAQANWEDTKIWNSEEDSIAGNRVEKGNIIFPRLEIEKELDILEKANQALIDRRTKKKEVGKVEEKKEVEETPEVTIDDFAKIELKVAK